MNINQNPIKMAGRFQTTAKLGKTYGQTVWWEAEEIDIPILGIDTFERLKLSVQQKKPNSKEKDQKTKRWRRSVLLREKLKIPSNTTQGNSRKHSKVYLKPTPRLKILATMSNIELILEWNSREAEEYRYTYKPR